VRLPDGERLSPQRFQQLGMSFGTPNGFDNLHYLLEGAFVDGPPGRELNYVFLRAFGIRFGFGAHPIYAILHEAIYCQETASNWAAQRVRAEFPEFEPSPDRTVFFTGEMIFPWMFDEYRYLRPLKEAAEILAAYDGWPRLYDREALAANTVPAVAAVYYDDMYVPRVLSEQTVKQVRGLRAWVTNEYEHGGIRDEGQRVLDRLLGMLHGTI